MSGPVRPLLFSFRWVAPSICLAASLTAGCAPSTTTPSTDATSDQAVRETRPVVFVVNDPLQYFARRIGGDLIE